MSFQHFRLGEMAMSNPPPHLMHLHDNTNNSFSNNASKISSGSSNKQPYGSGDTDDGYTLVFPNLAAFNEWREREEETQVVEFVKGDTHGSKAIPPRFKDHTKLVCARHSRSGRKKYVKKHPERVRKVPSRKLEGQGCPASISYKTYFDTDEIRACYNSQHSHEIGPANLPFTRRGRRAAAEAEKNKSNKHIRFANDTNSGIDASTSAQIAGPSTVPQPSTSNNYSSAVSMIAPLPTPQNTYQQTPSQSYNYQPQFQYTSGPAPAPAPVPPPPAQTGDAFNNDRWANMETLFQSVREHARTFTYPSASVAVLETVLIRLFLESPAQAGMAQQPMTAPMMQQPMPARMEEEGDGSSEET
ncbi:hypothetical protein FB446DRAFT_738167 [Lentinula raphanica]|nr:hypothetical protein FB446DRAFT_738167 [Lentinula raphanica]